MRWSCPRLRLLLNDALNVVVRHIVRLSLRNDVLQLGVFAAGSALPPSLTATASSRPILAQIFALAPSVFSFFLLILFHLECPDIDENLPSYPHKFKLLYHSSRAISIAISCAFAKIEESSPDLHGLASGKTTVFCERRVHNGKALTQCFLAYLHRKRIIPPHGEQQNGIAVCRNRAGGYRGQI